MTPRPSVRPATPADAEFIRTTLEASWLATAVIADGRRYDATALPALVAERDGEPVGLLTYERREDELLVVSLDALVRRSGIGRELMAAATALARDLGCARVRLTTSNELLDAIRFYLALGMRLVEVRLDAMDEARQLKPVLATHAPDGTPIRDEWVFELDLGPGAGA